MRNLVLPLVLALAACGGYHPRQVNVRTDQPEVFDVNLLKPAVIEMLGHWEDVAAVDLSHLTFEIDFVGRGGKHNCPSHGEMSRDIVGCHSRYGDTVAIQVLAVEYHPVHNPYQYAAGPQVFWAALAHEIGHEVEFQARGNIQEHRRRQFWAGAAGASGAPPRNADGSLGLVPQVEIWTAMQPFPYTGDNLPAIIYTNGAVGSVVEYPENNDDSAE